MSMESIAGTAGALLFAALLATAIAGARGTGRSDHSSGHSYSHTSGPHVVSNDAFMAKALLSALK